jgi:hypothetical protein
MEFDEITKRTHFSSEPAQIETSCMLSNEAARACPTSPGARQDRLPILR